MTQGLQNARSRRPAPQAAHQTTYRFAIFGQFLIESVSLSLVGGIIGSTLGLGITLLAGTQFEDGLSISPMAILLSVAFAVLIGLTAGVYPALRASRLAPVDALRA